LESIVYGNPSSERVAYQHEFKSVLPLDKELENGKKNFAK